MKNFADVIRLPAPHKEKVELNNLASRAQMIMSSISEEANVKIQLNRDENEVVLFCDPHQIQQVLIIQRYILVHMYVL